MTMQTLTRKPRRKWAFKDRETAELVAEERGHDLHRRDAVLNGMLNGEVVWCKQRGDDTGSYRFGYLARRNETIFVYVWDAKKEGQRPSMTVMGESEARKLMERLRESYGMDKLGRKFRDGLQECWNVGMKAV
jgi:hypothetical protein